MVTSTLLYVYGIGWSARWGYLSTSVSIQPEPERPVLDLDTSALARKQIPYAFSRTLQVFKRFKVLFMAHFITHIKPNHIYLSRY